MARRVIRTDRVIAVLGVAVLALGALILWRVSDRFVHEPQVPAERARQQLRDYDRTLTLFDVRDGRTEGVVCGFAGTPRAGDAPPDAPLAFVSRPNRLLTARDPLSGEFSAQLARECPDLMLPVPMKLN